MLLREKEHPSEAVHMYLYEKSKNECQDKYVCENEWEKIKKKLEFIENRKYLFTFINLSFSEVEPNDMFLRWIPPS